ncbi:MAG: integrase/recombinase XerD [Candidatus Latescibacterota bacterium]|jgi:integrase/recombinase XerD
MSNLPSRPNTASIVRTEERMLTRSEFQTLADVPPELEWFANIENDRTRDAYRRDLRDFTTFLGTQTPEEFRTVTRSHVIAWRNALRARNL